MFNPSISGAEGPENNYMITAIIGKRARQIQEGSKKLADCNSKNAVTISICEYKANKLGYTTKKAIPIKKHKKISRRINDKI